MSTVVAKSSREIVARNVRALRKRFGWSQAKLANRVNRAQPRIAEIENARHDLSCRIIDELCDAFGVTQAELLNEHLDAEIFSQNVA